MLLLLIAGFLWLLHPPTAAIFIIILLPYILINIKAHPLSSFSTFLAILVPIIISLPWFSIRILPTAKKLLIPQYLPPHVDVPALLLMYGILPVVFFFFGTIFLIKKGGKYNFGLMLGLVSLLIIGLVLVQLHFGLMILYFRGLTTMLLLISIIAGAGLFWIRTFPIQTQLLVEHKSKLFRNHGIILCAMSVVTILAIAIPARLNITYYHMIDNEDYATFIWVRDHTTTDNAVSLVDPWKASAFSALTGKNILHRITTMQQPVDDIIYRFLNNGCPATGFIEENKIAIIYNRLQCNNNKLARVRDNLFITDFNMLADFTSANMLQNAGFEAAYGTLPAFWSRRLQNNQPLFIFPGNGRNGGTYAAIQMSSTEPLEPWPVARWVQNIPVRAGKAYIISGWIKTNNITGQGGVGIAVQWRDSAGKGLKVAGLMAYVKGTNEWTCYDGKVTAPAGAATCSIYCEIAGCSGTAWFDDICFKEE